MTIPLAHAAGGGGTGIDQFVLAGGVVALGVAFLMQKQVSRTVSFALVALGIAGIAASFTVLRGLGAAEGTITVDGQQYQVEQLQDAVSGLCAARFLAVDDFEAARLEFLDRSHAALHVIAGAIEDDDRATAAQLLEAKQQVERDLSERASGEELQSDLSALITSTRAAMRTLSIPSPPC